MIRGIFGTRLYFEFDENGSFRHIGVLQCPMDAGSFHLKTHGRIDSGWRVERKEICEAYMLGHAKSRYNFLYFQLETPLLPASFTRIMCKMLGRLQSGFIFSSIRQASDCRGSF